MNKQSLKPFKKRQLNKIIQKETLQPANLNQNFQLIINKNNYLQFDLNQLYSLNEFIKASSNRNSYGWVLKKKATQYVKLATEQQIRSKSIYFNFPCGLLFIWNVNHKKDPDNISSAGRKAILDGFQLATYRNNQTKFLVNDNSRYIQGFMDQFIYQKQNSVKIFPYNQANLKQLIKFV